jgi:hypothetical protein
MLGRVRGSDSRYGRRTEFYDRKGSVCCCSARLSMHMRLATAVCTAGVLQKRSVLAPAALHCTALHCTAMRNALSCTLLLYGARSTTCPAVLLLLHPSLIPREVYDRASPDALSCTLLHSTGCTTCLYVCVTVLLTALSLLSALHHWHAPGLPRSSQRSGA